MSLPIYQPKRIRQIAVAAGKGGVGKSTVAAALAVSLRNRGQKVGLLDADLYGPSLARMLPLDDSPRVDGERILPAMCEGIQLVSMAHFDQGWAGLRAPMANGVISRFLSRVDWGELDTLVIDFPPGTGDIQLTLCQQAALSCALLVTTPQQVALDDVRRAANLFSKMEVPILGLVENMSYLEVGEERIRPFGELSSDLDLPIVGEIPIDPELCQRCDRGEVAGYRSSQFAQIAELVEGWFGDSSVPEMEPADRHHVRLVWPDGEAHLLRLSEIQRQCPCASCRDQGAKTEPDLRANALQIVGNYGVRFDFLSGCSSGIYPFSLLREITLNFNKDTGKI